MDTADAAYAALDFAGRRGKDVAGNSLEERLGVSSNNLLRRIDVTARTIRRQRWPADGFQNSVQAVAGRLPGSDWRRSGR